MTKEQALQIIDQALSKIDASRQSHILFQQALDALREKPDKEEDLSHGQNTKQQT